ncbi:MAG: glycosyltransferase family 39 protein [Thermoanaerobaculia bacterium]
MEPQAAGRVAAGSGLTRSAASRRLAALLVASAVAFVVPVWWGLPSPSGWAVDEIVPSHVVPAEAWPDKYPPLHRYLLTASTVVVESVGRAVGVEAPGIETARFLASRLLSTLMALATLWLLYRVARVGENRSTALWTVALAAPSLPFVYYAKTANLDGPYVFWFVFSALFYLRALARGRAADYLGLGLTAACAVATKDQAYGLYVLMPLLLALDLARRRREQGGSGWGALADRRLWLGAAGATAVLVVVFWLSEDGELARHFAVLTGERAVGQYRIYAPTLGGQLQEAVGSLRHVAVAVGVPTALAALAGAALAVSRRRRHRAALALAVTALSYYAFFLAPIGYNYVRFFLPVVPVVALLAAVALERSSRFLGARPAWRVVVALALLAWPWSRALALDLHMLGDARYGAEEWLRSTGLEARAVGLGNELHLPRGLRTVEWKVLAEAPCRSLRRLGSAVLVVDPDEVRGEQERATLAWLDSGLAGYGEPRRFTNRFPADLFHRPEVLWNLNKISREITIYRATGGECFDTPGVRSRLDRVRAGGRISDRPGLAAAVAYGLVETRPLRGERLVVAGVSPDRWTRGRRAALLLARARPSRPLQPSFAVVPPPDREARLWIEDGSRPVREVAVEGPETTVRLPEVPAGGTAVFIVWTDAAWSPPGSRRVLGVRLMPERD